MTLLPFKELFKLLLVAMVSSSTLFCIACILSPLLAGARKSAIIHLPYLENFSLLASSVCQVAFRNHCTKRVWHCLKLKQKDKIMHIAINYIYNQLYKFIHSISGYLLYNKLLDVFPAILDNAVKPQSLP